MAKTIKFNLICDNKPIRTIEDLQNNFSIEDVLAYYNNKILHRWLEVRSYTEELEKVNNIAANKPIEIIKELIKIFNVMSDDKKVEESIYILKYLDKRQELYSVYDKENYNIKTIIHDYESGYRQLVIEILKNPNNAAKIKAAIAEMVTNYAWILQLNYRNLFYFFETRSVLTIMCLLMNEQSRRYYLPIEYKYEDVIAFMNTSSNDKAIVENDRETIFQRIRSMITTSEFKTALGENLITFSGVTDGYWKDLEPNDKKYMIINMDQGDFVRSAGLSGGDLNRDNVFNKFVIVDGIDYKSNSDTHQLIYMEV